MSLLTQKMDKALKASLKAASDSKLKLLNKTTIKNINILLASIAG